MTTTKTQLRRVGKAQRAHHSLPKRPDNILHVTAPIGRDLPTFDKAMKTAVRPVCDTRHVSMLHGIEMDIVDVAVEIDVVADRVLPIATLPDSFFRVLTSGSASAVALRSHERSRS